MSKRFCDQCRNYGHTKWLWGGTHWSHRLYLRWHMRKVIRNAKRKARQK